MPASTKTRRRAGASRTAAIDGRKNPAPLWPTRTGVSVACGGIAALITASGVPVAAASVRSGMVTS
jgi:hypothetical protein